MDGLMMDTPLSLVHLFDRNTRLFPDKGVITASPGTPRATSSSISPHLAPAGCRTP